MSVISVVNTIGIYDAKNPPVIAAGSCLLVSRGNAKSGTVSISASPVAINKEEIAARIVEFMPALEQLVHTERVKLVRAMWASGKKEIHDEQVGLDAVLVALGESSNGRLSGDSIKQWMRTDGNVAMLQAAFIEKFGWQQVSSLEQLTTAQRTKVDTIINALIDTIAELAGRRTYWLPPKCVVAKSYLELLEDGAMKEKLLGILDNMETRKGDDDLMEALGF